MNYKFFVFFSFIFVCALGLLISPASLAGKPAYQTIDGRIYRVDPGSGKKYPIKNKMREGFEGSRTFKNLFGIKRGWTDITIQSPAAPHVKDYVAVKKRIMKGTGDFIDNRIDITSKRAKFGRQSLRFFSKAPGPQNEVSKCSLDTHLLHVAKGDMFQFSGWFYLEKGQPVTLLDIEAADMRGGPGIRILLTDDLVPYGELKWFPKTKFRPIKGKHVPMPKGEWANIKMSMYVSNSAKEGHMRIWVNDEIVVDKKGKTLPKANVIYDRLEVGITAHTVPEDTILYLDNFLISNGPARK